MPTNEAIPPTEPDEIDFDAIADAEFGELADAAPAEDAEDETRQRNLEALYAVPLTIAAQLGQTQLTIRELLSLSPGSVLELDRTAGESIDIYVNGVRVGSGEAVVVNDNYGLRITELLSPEERLASL
jgi:flagellar motor switch protein FliN/FliY